MNRLKGGSVMDRNELISEIAGSSAEGFAAFQRDLLARRTEVMRGRLAEPSECGWTKKVS